MPSLWGKRLVALIVDFVIVTLILWVLVAVIYPLIALLNALVLFNIWIPLTAIFIVAYFTYFEGKHRTTPGKSIMKLKVRAKEGEMGYKKALIRNLSKFLWLPLIVDVIVGFAIGNQERYLDRLAKTEVVKTEEVESPSKDSGQSTT